MEPPPGRYVHKKLASPFQGIDRVQVSGFRFWLPVADELPVDPHVVC